MWSPKKNQKMQEYIILLSILPLMWLFLLLDYV